MTLPPFRLERWFAEHEFSVEHVLGGSDVDGWPMADLLALADPELRTWWESLTLGYTETAGHPLLREAIAELYDGIDPDDVVVTSGAEEAIYVLAHATVRPGDHVVVVTPCYQSLLELPRSLGGDVTELQLREDDDWRLTAARLKAAISPRTKLVIWNIPHNPTGMLPTADEVRELVSVATAGSATLISDEVYRFLAHDGGPKRPAAADLSRHAVSIGVMSKSFALAGLRIGWFATKDRAVRDRAIAHKDYTTICPSGPSEVLATIALREREVVLARSRDIVGGNLELLDQFLDGFDGAFSWVRPAGGSTGFPRLHGDIPADAFCEELLREERVLLSPGRLFGDHQNNFRVGLGRLDTLAALEKLDRFANRWLTAFRR